MLQPDQLDLAILAELPNNKVLNIKAEELNKPISLINRIIAANRTVESFNALQTQTHINNSNLKLENKLLLY